MEQETLNVQWKLQKSRDIRFLKYKRCFDMFTDEAGATRHATSGKELDGLYRRLENSIAGCTVGEAEESRDAFVGVQTMICQRTGETKKQY